MHVFRSRLFLFFCIPQKRGVNRRFEEKKRKKRMQCEKEEKKGNDRKNGGGWAPWANHARQRAASTPRDMACSSIHIAVVSAEYIYSPAHTRLGETSMAMMTSSNEIIFRWSFARSPLDPPHKDQWQWRGALMFSLICAWTNGWVNNRDAGDLRRHCDHYDVTVMA